MSFNITPPNATIYRDFTREEIAHMNAIDEKIKWAYEHGFVTPKFSWELVRDGLPAGIETCPLCFYDFHNKTVTPSHGHRGE